MNGMQACVNVEMIYTKTQLLYRAEKERFGVLCDFAYVTEADVPFIPDTNLLTKVQKNADLLIYMPSKHTH
jgi:hypothetical protein